MCLTPTDIATIAKEISHYRYTQIYKYPQYLLHINDDNTLDISDKTNRYFSIRTPHLSDIHTILQLCHPHQKYYIRRDIHLSDNCPKLPVYIYQDQPDIITTQHPAIRYNTNEQGSNYILRLDMIPDITIIPDEDFIHADNRMTNNLRTLLPFVPQYPDIEYQQHELQFEQPNMSHPDISLIGIIKRAYPSSISIRLYLYLYHIPDRIDVPPLTISIDDIPNIPTIYHAHIAQTLPDIIQYIQQHLTHSQHEKIHIIRAITQQLTPHDNDVLPKAQKAATIMHDHFIYIGTPPDQSPPSCNIPQGHTPIYST